MTSAQLNRQIEHLRQAVRRTPDDPALHYDLGGLLLQAGRPADAISSYRAALALAPGHPQVLLQLGNALSALGRHAEAATQFHAALRSDPDQPAAYYNLGNALRELGLPEQAADAYRKALRLMPHDADAHNNLGNVLRELGRLDEAVACYREALRRNPQLYHARMHLLHQRMHMCDWDGLMEEIAAIRDIVRTVPTAQISPFAFLALPGTTAAEQRQCAAQWTANRWSHLIEDGKRLAYAHPPAHPGRLRIGYLSADFRQHPLAWLATELMELHDRSAFEIYAYSYGPNDKSPARLRWERAFDHFCDIRDLSLHEAAQRIYADRIDILVDLTGYTQSSRSGLMALRPAPLQVNWLGFPGTMGAPFVDYLISDPTVTPATQVSNFSEQLVLLPDTYQPNDRKRPVAEVPSRMACGLPAQGLVFCCFNQTFKITPQVFDIWMNLLNETPGSVLWLLECNPWAKANLQREAMKRGVAAERLVFAPRVPVEQHLARHRCADLLLDTLPYNAHTTTSDALWMGLPVLTCQGDTFASRVAASLLHAANLPQLVTTNLEAYAARARALAQHPEELRAMRAKLDRERANLPLFDTPRFARHLEAAYREMYRRYADGLAPQGFALSVDGNVIPFAHHNIASN